MALCSTCGKEYDGKDQDDVKHHTEPFYEKGCCRKCQYKPLCYTCNSGYRCTCPH